MAASRAQVQAFFLKYIDKMMPGSENTKLYKEMFEAMSDKEFDTFITDLETGKKFFVLVCPNFSPVELNVERNLGIADELGHEFFQRLWIEGKGEQDTYLTPIPYLVGDVIYRRASQLLSKKISVPKHNRVVDAMTGQPTGESKGAKISHPELQVLSAMGMDFSLVELMKYRGGDNRGRAALSGMISRFGSASIKSLQPYASGVESTATLKTFLNAAHLKSTL